MKMSESTFGHVITFGACRGVLRFVGRFFWLISEIRKMNSICFFFAFFGIYAP